MRIALVVLCLLALTASIAFAQTTINMQIGDLAANGWKVTTKDSGLGGTPSVTQAAIGGSNGFHFQNSAEDESNHWGYAGISTGAYAGKTIADLTSLKIKVWGVSGDNPSNWQPPTFQIVAKKSPTNPAVRVLTWIAWPNAGTRAPGGWMEYDLATSGVWLNTFATTTQYNWTSFKSTFAPYVICTDAEALGYTATNQSFNVGLGTYINQEAKYFTRADGWVDWFEVGMNSNVTRYDLNEGAVPEPSSLLALGTGLFGLLGVIKRRK